MREHAAVSELVRTGDRNETGDRTGTGDRGPGGGAPGDDLLVHAFDCPRCGSSTSSPFHGPCPSCSEELRAAVVGTAREVEVEAYAPKMNVTPNAVATKD